MTLLLILLPILLIIILIFILVYVPSPFVSPLLPENIQQHEKTKTRPRNDSVDLSSIRCVGVHNGCHVANLLSIFIPPWSYTHISILSQLKLGLRHVEIDAWYERSTSSWKVFHEFVDPLTNETPSLVVDCLKEICDYTGKC